MKIEDVRKRYEEKGKELQDAIITLSKFQEEVPKNIDLVDLSNICGRFTLQVFSLKDLKEVQAYLARQLGFWRGSLGTIWEWNGFVYVEFIGQDYPVDIWLCEKNKEEEIPGL